MIDFLLVFLGLISKKLILYEIVNVIGISKYQVTFFYSIRCNCWLSEFQLAVLFVKQNRPIFFSPFSQMLLTTHKVERSLGIRLESEK